jgi:hypothetical protein
MGGPAELLDDAFYSFYFNYALAKLIVQMYLIWLH